MRSVVPQEHSVVTCVVPQIEIEMSGVKECAHLPNVSRSIGIVAVCSDGIPSTRQAFVEVVVRQGDVELGSGVAYCRQVSRVRE